MNADQQCHKTGLEVESKGEKKEGTTEEHLAQGLEFRDSGLSWGLIEYQVKDMVGRCDLNCGLCSPRSVEG